MTITLATSPAYPPPGAACNLIFTSNVGSNLVKIYATSAPVGTKLRAQIDDDQLGRRLIATGDIVGKFPFEPEVGGVYVFSVEEYTAAAFSYGGGYERDPNAAPSETLNAITSVSLEVGTKLTCSVGTGPDTATLTFWVFGSTVRATTKEVHGAVTPALSAARSPKAAAAMEVSAVKTAVAALAGQAASTLVGTPSSAIDNLLAKFDAHRTQTGVHANNDTHNVVEGSFRGTGHNPDGQAQALGELLVKLDRHMRNDNAGGGTGTGNYHQPASPGAVNRGDFVNLPIVLGAQSDPLSIVVGIAAAWAAFEPHRTSGVHTASDSTNAATALAPLLDVHRLFLAELKKASPTAAATVHTGLPVLVYQGGMTEE